MPTKKCKGYNTPDGEKNPDCEKTFWVEPNHFKTRPRCNSCQRLKNNVYHKNYLRKRRAEQKEESKIF